MRTVTILAILLASLPLLSPSSTAQSESGFSGLPAGRSPRVEIGWNRFYDYHELLELMDRLEAHYPRLLSHEVIGFSVENREMRVYTLTNRAAGRSSLKPAMWVDGNVHGNEVQGGEVVAYLAWYLLENYETNEEVTRLVDECAFYLLPSVNPDGRAHWFGRGHSASSSRSGVFPVDSDRDGMFDEDPSDDLDGDGTITRMRKYLPGEGTHRLDPTDPRIMIPVARDGSEPPGDWILLGSEGIDNDGDGRINEDGIGGYDMNRSWPSIWQPEHVQPGAGPYPLYWPEARNVARFLYDHLNVAALQSFHNAGGMILRGPGAESFGEYPRADLRVFDELGRDGEKMLPFYRYMTLWKDLYTVFGGFVTWGYEGLGIISFTNELWTSKRSSPDQRLGRSREDRLWFDDHLLMGEGYIDWHPFEHPLYGEVELGGFKKDIGRVPPSFLVEEMLHRNALFCIHHARAMPRVTIGIPEVTNLGGDVFAVDVVFENSNAIPTRTAHAAAKGIGSPDIFQLEGRNLEVLAGGFRNDRFRPESLELQDFQPARLIGEAGIGRRDKIRVRWIVRGHGTALVLFESEKAVNRDRVFEIE
jgi:hypothetical protein